MFNNKIKVVVVFLILLKFQLSCIHLSKFAGEVYQVVKMT